MKKTISIILTIALCLIMILPNFIYAGGDIDPNAYKDIYKNQGNTKLLTAGGNVLAVARTVGIACGVILLLILGIKYIYMSHDANDKASIKEKLIPYVIGAVLLFGGSGLLGLVANFAQKMDNDAPANNSSYYQPTTNFVVCPGCSNYVPDGYKCISCGYRF